MKTQATCFSLLLAFATCWSLAPIVLAAPPANDNFASATALATDTGTLAGTTVGATDEVSENLSYGRSSIWYAWTPSLSGRATVDTFGSAFDTELSAWSGLDIPTLMLLEGNDDTGGPQSRITFNVTGGTVYHLRIAGYGGSTGATVLNWFLKVPPPNDNFADAAVIAGTTGMVDGNTTGSTVESDESYSYNFSVWYAWTAPFTGTVQFDTIGSAVDTTLELGTGTSLADLVVIAHNDDSSAVLDGTSRIRVLVTSGTTYSIRLASATEGQFTLNWSQVAYIPGVISFSNPTYLVSESNGSATITVNRTIGTDDVFVDATLQTRDGSAVNGADYIATNYGVFFPPGAITQTVNISVLPDRQFEGEETVRLFLVFPGESANLGTATATLLIADDDPFIPLKASYAGLISPPVYDHALTGCLNLTASGNGAYSAVLKLGPDTFRFKGSFDSAGVSTPAVSPAFAFTLVYADDGDTIRSTLAQSATPIVSESYRVLYGGGVYYPNGANQGFVPPTFTIRLPGVLADPGDTPKGDGYLAASISKFGAVKVAGSLPDGTVISAAGPLAGRMFFPLYSQLYKKTGSFSTLLYLQPVGASGGLATHWYKPANPAAKTFKDAIDRALVLAANRYVNDPSRCILPDLGYTRGLADFFAQKGGLPADLTQVFSLSEANKVALPMTPAVKLTMKFTTRSGLFSGTFQSGQSAKTSFKGAVFQNDGFGSGYFLRATSGQTAGGLVKFMPAQ